jgi:hypothetical protein
MLTNVRNPFVCATNRILITIFHVVVRCLSVLSTVAVSYSTSNQGTCCQPGEQKTDING